MAVETPNGRMAAVSTSINLEHEGPEDPKAAHLSFAGPFKDHNIKLHIKPQNSRCNNLKQDYFCDPFISFHTKGRGNHRGTRIVLTISVVDH